MQTNKKEKTSKNPKEEPNTPEALQGKKAKKGIFITTSTFSKQALEYIDMIDMIDNKIILINGKQLANLMIENEIGVSAIKTYQVNRIDNDYFLEE